MLDLTKRCCTVHPADNATVEKEDLQVTLRRMRAGMALLAVSQKRVKALKIWRAC